MHCFRHITVSTLSHLLALLLHPHSDVFRPDTGLLIIDGLNALIDLDYPRYQFSSAARTEPQKWQASRRYAILGSLVAAMNKLAALHDLAVIVTTGCSTRMRPDSNLGAALVPGIGGAEWEGGIWNRFVVFRDFAGRFVGVQKCRGRSLISRDEVGEVGRIIPFDISLAGRLHERHAADVAHNSEAVPVQRKGSLVKPPKRAFDEIADSDGEDVDKYGWAETDEDAIAVEGLAVEVPPVEAAADPG